MRWGHCFPLSRVQLRSLLTVRNTRVYRQDRRNVENAPRARNSRDISALVFVWKTIIFGFLQANFKNDRFRMFVRVPFCRRDSRDRRDVRTERRKATGSTRELDAIPPSDDHRRNRQSERHSSAVEKSNGYLCETDWNRLVRRSARLSGFPFVGLREKS